MASFIVPVPFLLTSFYIPKREEIQEGLAITLALNDILGTFLKVISHEYVLEVHYFCLSFPNVKMHRVKTNLIYLSRVV